MCVINSKAPALALSFLLHLISKNREHIVKREGPVLDFNDSHPALRRSSSLLPSWPRSTNNRYRHSLVWLYSRIRYIVASIWFHFHFCEELNTSLRITVTSFFLFSYSRDNHQLSDDWTPNRISKLRVRRPRPPPFVKNVVHHRIGGVQSALGKEKKNATENYRK